MFDLNKALAKATEWVRAKFAAGLAVTPVKNTHVEIKNEDFEVMMEDLGKFQKVQSDYDALVITSNAQKLALDGAQASIKKIKSSLRVEENADEAAIESRITYLSKLPGSDEPPKGQNDDSPESKMWNVIDNLPHNKNCDALYGAPKKEIEKK